MTKERLDRLPIAIHQMEASAPLGLFEGYPRPVREVHQLEITSRCNLRCKYCPHFPALPREKLDITDELVEQAMSLVKHYVRKGTQTELALTGIGEPTLHPKFAAIVEHARRTIGHDRPLTFSTNGIELSDELLDAIAPFNPRIYVSMHRPEVAAPAAIRAQKHGLLAGINNSFVTSAFDWGGKVEWHTNAPATVCEFLRAGWAVIMADGRITTCCMDADGAGVIGRLGDAPESLFMKPYSLCAGCHMVVPERGQIIG